jgi:precorrin-6A/cobalt-precorrin-6A reductase
MILLMGGTVDARMLAVELQKQFPAAELLATAVSEYGARLLRESARCDVLCGALDADGLSRVIQERGIRVLIDATHPFAAGATAEAKKAAALTGTAYLRFERPSAAEKRQGYCHLAANMAEAARTAAALGDNVFVTIGTRQLPQFMAALPPGKKVVARVLPVAQSLEVCLQSGLSPAEVVAVLGPVSKRLNKAMFLEYKAQVVVAKDSGKRGGTPAKIAAARELKIPLVLVEPPPGGGGYGSEAALLAEVGRILSSD